ncbi:MAG: hypothetical protein RIS79_340, partial [Verrucomicrobiota bacterium]
MLNATAQSFKPAFYSRLRSAVLITTTISFAPWSALLSQSDGLRPDQTGSLFSGNPPLAQINAILSPNVAPAVTTAGQAAKTPPYQSAEGPWGRLVGDYIYLEAPAALVENFALPSTQTRWTFPAASEPLLSKLFNSAGLTE